MSTTSLLYGTGTNDANSTGNIAFTNPGNISAQDNTCATAVIPKAGYTKILKAAFTFSLPAEAVIDGVVVKIKRMSSSGYSLQDKTVQLRNGTTYLGSNKATTTVYTPTNTEVTYGADSDVWGAVLTPALLNSGSFNVAFQAKNSSSTSYGVLVDSISAQVTYHLVYSDTVSDSIKSSESNGIFVTLLGSSSEGIKNGEALANAGQLSSMVTDGAKQSESVPTTATMPAASADNLFLAEDHNTNLTTSGIGLDGLAGTDSDGATGVLGANTYDGFHLSDQSSGALALLLAVVDGYKLNEIPLGFLLYEQAAQECLKLYDSPLGGLLFSAAVGDAVTATESSDKFVSVFMLGSESLTGSDTIQTLAALCGSAVDVVKQSENLTGSLTMSATGADTILGGDGALLGYVTNPCVYDALVGAENSNGTLIFPVAVSDGTQAGEALIAGLVIPLSTADSIVTSDSNTNQIAFAAGCLDGLKQSDTTSSIMNGLAAAVDGLLGAEQSAGFIENTYVAADGLKNSDAQQNTLTALGLSPDGIKLLESLSSVYQGTVAALDGIVGQEYASMGSFYSMGAQDGFSAGEMLSQAAIFANLLTEGLKTSDTPAAGRIIPLTAAEGITSSDSSSSAVTLLGALYDALSTGEATSGGMDYLNSVLDGISSIDAVAGSVLVNALVSEGFNAAEVNYNYGLLLAAASEFVNHGELPRGTKQFADIILSDGTRVGDSHSVYTALLATAVAGLKTSEVIDYSAFTGFLMIVSEQLNMSDANSTQHTMENKVSESVKTVDALLVGLAASLVAQDAITANDQVKTALAILSLCSDGLFPSDTGIVNVMQMARAVESISLSEDGHLEATLVIGASDSMSAIDTAVSILNAVNAASDQFKSVENQIISGAHLGDGVCVTIDAVFETLRNLPIRHEFKLANTAEYGTLKPRSTGEFKVSSASITFKVRG